MTKIRAPSCVQRSRGQAWRRLIIRCSATRRPHFMFQIYTRVANFEIVSHAAVVVDEDKFQSNSFQKWFQFVQMEVERWALMRDVCKLFIL